MAPSDRDRAAQTTSERAALGGDVASQALNEALRVSFRLLKLAMILVAGLFLGSGIFTVKSYEQAFKLRFGRLVTYRDKTGAERAKLEPGLHFAWPFLIDEVVRFPVKKALTQEIDDFWYEQRPRKAWQALPAGIAPGRGGFALTGDANILHSRWSVRYRIADPVRAFERLTDPDPAALAAGRPTGVMRDLMSVLLRNAVIRSIAGFSVDDAYTYGRDSLVRAVESSLKAQLKKLDVGIELDDVLLSEIVPPLQVKAAFEEVQNAEQDNRKLILDAQGEHDRTINQAKAVASRMVAEAKAYKENIKAQTEADAEYLKKLLEKYKDSPEALDHFLRLRLVEVIHEILSAADDYRLLSTKPPKGRREVRILLRRHPKALIERRRREALERSKEKR